MISTGNAHNEYLVSHGKNGGFGRFRAEQPLVCSRGERVVIASERGLEVGTVLCPATDKHQRLLADTPIGQLLRRLTPEDEEQARKLQALGQQLFEQARALAAQQQLPFEVLDVEMFLDGRQAVLQYLTWETCDLEPFLSALADDRSLTLTLEDLSTPMAKEEEEEEHGGCGQPGCGRADGGGCSSCGSGGCSSCGSGEDVREYFAHLRTKMEEKHQQRVPLV